MRKSVIAASLAAGSLVVAAGCGSSKSGRLWRKDAIGRPDGEQQGALGQKLDLSTLSPSIKDPSSPVTITYQTWQDFSKGSLPALAAQFHKKHPNITIKFENVPAEQAGQVLTTRIAGKNAPDVAYVNASDTADYAARGALVDLADYIGRSDVVKPDDYVEAFKTFVT